MKKVLALVLAVVLCMGLGTMAFAADYADTDGTQKIAITVDTDGIKAEDLKATLSWNDGKEYFKSVELDDTDPIGTTAGTAAVYESAAIEALTADGDLTIAGHTVAITVSSAGTLAAQLAAWKSDFDSNGTIKGDWTAAIATDKITLTEKVNEGKTLSLAGMSQKTAGVAAVTTAVPAGVKVTVKFKDYYGVDDIDIDFDLNLKKGSTKKAITEIATASDAAVTTTASDAKTINVKTTFGWDAIAEVSPADRDDASITVPKIGSGAVVFDDENVTFVTFEFAAADALSVAGKMSKQAAVNMALDVAVTDEIKALMKKNEDVDFDVLNFKGAPEFDFTQEVTYSIEDEDVTYYVYEIKDGKATKVNAKLNDDKDALVWKTRVLGTYIVTDAEIKAADAADEGKTEDGEKENPETGATDFVGVAVALGTVSLVAAGAVALKK